MNIIQLARSMGDELTFGDLPETTIVLDTINAVIPEDEEHLTSTSTGNEFLEVYESLRPAQQNKLAGIFDEQPKIMLAITTDIMQWEASERKRENQAHQQTMKLGMIFLMVMLSMIVYTAYTYHRTAKAEMGDSYKSEVLDTVHELFDFMESHTVVEKAESSK